MLFDMFLAGAFNWGLGKSLDVLTKCFVCSEEDNYKIENVNYNHIECSNCHKESQQFSNVCDFTLNKMNGEIGHVLLNNTTKDFRASKEISFLNGDKISKFSVPIQILTTGMANKPFILEANLSPYSGYQDHTISKVIQPHRNGTRGTETIECLPDVVFDLLGGSTDTEIDKRSGNPLEDFFLDAPKTYVSSSITKQPIEIKYKAISKNREILFEDNHFVELSDSAIRSLNKNEFLHSTD